MPGFLMRWYFSKNVRIYVCKDTIFLQNLSRAEPNGMNLDLAGLSVSFKRRDVIASLVRAWKKRAFDSF